MSRTHALPGFGPALGLTLAVLGALVVLPMAALAVKASSLGLSGIWSAVAHPRVLAACGLSLGAAFLAAAVNAVFGLAVAWVLVRYAFPGRSVVDAMVDLPFALPTAVGGIALTTLLAKTGWVGKYTDSLGIPLAYSRAGIVVALVFTGLPFVVRSVQPVLEELEPELEEAAAVLGATRLATFRRVVFPALLPALLTGFALAFARGVGEYGSVVFISGNMPMRTEIAPLLIMTKLEQFDYAGAAAIAVVLLLVSLVLLVGLALLQARTGARGRG